MYQVFTPDHPGPESVKNVRQAHKTRPWAMLIGRLVREVHSSDLGPLYQVANEHGMHRPLADCNPGH